ncbi:MAG: hypothetical protein NT178_03965 [Proteobacteria bacterium]|nr:hypothetical protein [Pseudomonadota bacterium]
MLKIKSGICNKASAIIKIIVLLVTILMYTTLLWSQDKVAVFPAAPYDRFTIYQTLAIFWIAIIGLIIIIKMKLREIERIQKMGIDKEEKDIPTLD